MSDSDDLLPALSEEEEEEEFDTVRPGQPSPVSHEPIAAEPVEEKPKGASVRLKTISSKKTAAPRQSASVRVSPLQHRTRMSWRSGTALISIRSTVSKPMA